MQKGFSIPTASSVDAAQQAYPLKVPEMRQK